MRGNSNFSITACIEFSAFRQAPFEKRAVSLLLQNPTCRPALLTPMNTYDPHRIESNKSKLVIGIFSKSALRMDNSIHETRPFQ